MAKVKIRILLFASFKEKAGRSDWTEEYSEGTTTGKVWESLKGRYPLSGMSEHVLMAVNEEFAQEDTPVKEGDTVAFFPPVSGG